MAYYSSCELSVLDLPQLHLRPSATSLLQTLSQLTLAPASWEQDETQISANETINEKGIAAFLTRIIASNLSWLTSEEGELVKDEASARLNERVGYSTIKRTFAIPTGNKKKKSLMVNIHEPALVESNVGHKTWGGSFLLAKRLHFMLPKHIPALQTNLTASPVIRILELGAGTGLTGIAASALFPISSTTHLTDLPSIVSNLARNINANAGLFDSDRANITSGVLDWSDLPSAIPSEEKYDIILSADSLYAPEHPGWLTDAMALYLKQSPNARILVELPYRDMDRNYHQELGDTMTEKGFECLDQGNEVGYEDWKKWDGRVQIKCWWSVWGWNQ